MKTPGSPGIEAARLAVLEELDLLGGQAFPELDRLTRLAAEICGAEASMLAVFDDSHEIQISVSSGAPGRKPREVTFCNHTLAGRSTMLVPDARLDDRLKANPYVVGDPHVCSYAGVCIGAELENPIGVLCVIHTKASAFGAVEMGRLKQVAALVNSFLESRLSDSRASRARRRQAQFQNIFDSIQEGANVYAPDGTVLEANPAALRLLGLPREQVMGRAPADPAWRTFRADGSPFHSEDYPVMRALRGKHTTGAVMGVELPDGERRWLSVNGTPVFDPVTGKLDFAVVTFSDITAQRAAEERLKSDADMMSDALHEAKRGIQAKTDFLSVMSHELRTPMNAVMGCAALLRHDPLSSQQNRTLGVLEEAGQQMLTLLDDLLDLSSLDSDKVRLNTEPTNLVRLIEDAAVIWAAEVRAKGLTLTVMIDPALSAPRDVDPARVLQVIGNLMANAIKFTTEGQVTIQAWPARTPSGAPGVAIEIEDTGPGVSLEAQSRIFSAFEQADVSTTRKHGGLGIGLHVARKLARAMGGDIQLDSREGEGARFTALLAAPPVAANDAGDAPPAQDDPPVESLSVLVVDDNPRNLYVLGAILRAAGHAVEESPSGADALERLGARPFDLVLLDMVMPEMDGMAVLARLRASAGPNAATPVVACTANVQPDQLKAYVAGGAVAVIPKPIDVTEVLRTVAATAVKAA